MHLFSDLTCKVENKEIIVREEVSLSFDGANAIRLDDYEMARGHNKYKAGKKVIVSFDEVLDTAIILKHQ